ncbi:MliC family protein [Ostreiculturibacter nitratireducens]|uniref:MliC family protein n=1 Tax=Ostreiculturibacter nitratireducens TaxID=3075226 RepID=UPI0031B63331
MLRTLPLLGVLAATPAFAQDGPSFDCSKADSSAEDLICEDADLARLDRRLAERYAAALEAVRGLDVAATEAETELRAGQRGWIKGRNDCWKADDLRDCVERSYLRREGELVARWILEEPTGIAFWACGGNPANEVVTFFFDTELPSVRFERGDQIDTGSLVPAASGSSYEGNFGRSIWIKGDEATYREPDPDGTSYACVLAQQR